MDDGQEILDQLVETWRTNNRINLFLIDRIGDEAMKATLSKRGGRNVVRQFCHLHNVRVWHLEARARDLAHGLHRFETHDEPDKATLKKHLEASATRLEAFFERAVLGTGKARPFEKGIVATLGYFIAHESHHRGSILLTLKASGYKLDDGMRYGIWDWDKI